MFEVEESHMKKRCAAHQFLATSAGSVARYYQCVRSMTGGAEKNVLEFVGVFRCLERTHEFMFCHR